MLLLAPFGRSAAITYKNNQIVSKKIFLTIVLTNINKDLVHSLLTPSLPKGIIESCKVVNLPFDFEDKILHCT